MIRPERDPHWLLGVEHGREGATMYQFADAENQRRYLAGYAEGYARGAASPYGQALGEMRHLGAGVYYVRTPGKP